MAKATRTDIESKLNSIAATTYADTVDGKLKSIEDHATLLGLETSYLGLTAESPKLAESTEAVAGIISKGTIDEEIKEGESYTLEAGYYEGGTVTGVAGGGNYSLEPKTATPTTAQQVITPSEGKYGLSQVTIDPIPAQYKDTTGTTATAADLLVGTSAMTAAGKIDGSMVNNGAVGVTLTTTVSSYDVPVGYHNGNGKVTVASQAKDAVPTEAEQIITGDQNKYLTSVTIAAIDKASYLTSWTEDATAVAADIFTGKTAYINGSKVEGTMANNANWDAADHVITTGGQTGDVSINIPVGYHDGTGTVKIVAQDKAAAALVPGSAQQVITADAGKVLNQVTVPALDSKYQDVSAVTAVATHVCEGYKFVDASGTVVTGTLTDGGDKKNTNFYSDLMASGSDGVTVLSGAEAHYTAVEATIDGSLYNRLAAI